MKVYKVHGHCSRVRCDVIISPPGSEIYLDVRVELKNHSHSGNLVLVCITRTRVIHKLS